MKCSCGCTTFTRSVRVTGLWEEFLIYDEEDKLTIESDGDSVRNMKQPKMIRCAECRKRHHNPDYIA